MLDETNARLDIRRKTRSPPLIFLSRCKICSGWPIYPHSLTLIAFKWVSFQVQVHLARTYTRARTKSPEWNFKKLERTRRWVSFSISIAHIVHTRYLHCSCWRWTRGANRPLDKSKNVLSPRTESERDGRLKRRAALTYIFDPHMLAYPWLDCLGTHTTALFVFPQQLSQPRYATISKNSI